MRIALFWSWLWKHPKVAIGLGIIGLFLLMAALGPVAFHNPNAMNAAEAVQGPSRSHWLGTTQTGQDVLQQVIVGSRNSLLLSFGIGLSATVLAVVVGLLAGYFGGLVDDILSLFINIFL